MSNTAEETGVVQDGTGAGLIAFLNWAIAKNELVDATASALRTGCQKVLSVEEDPNAVDLRTANLDNIIDRFKTKHRMDMKDRTREQYEQRFRQSVEMYMKWLDNDPTWKPTTRRRTSTPKPSSNGGAAKVSAPSTPNVAAETPSASQGGGTHHGPALITYPFPIRPGLQGKISLPEDLTMREAKRIAAFVSTLALEEEPTQQLAITAGDPWDE